MPENIPEQYKIIIDKIHNKQWTGLNKQGLDLLETGLSTKSITYYSLLQIDRTAAESIIKTTYRKLALIFHPDKTKTNLQHEQEIAGRIFKLIQSAYETLTSLDKRNAYDRGENKAEFKFKAMHESFDFGFLNKIKYKIENASPELIRETVSTIRTTAVSAYLSYFYFKHTECNGVDFSSYPQNYIFVPEEYVNLDSAVFRWDQVREFLQELQINPARKPAGVSLQYMKIKTPCLIKEQKDFDDLCALGFNNFEGITLDSLDLSRIECKDLPHVFKHSTLKDIALSEEQLDYIKDQKNESDFLKNTPEHILARLIHSKRLTLDDLEPELQVKMRDRRLKSANYVLATQMSIDSSNKKSMSIRIEGEGALIKPLLSILEQKSNTYM